MAPLKELIAANCLWGLACEIYCRDLPRAYP